MMMFSIGVWDALFGEKTIMEIPNVSGEIVRRSVTAKWIEKFQNKDGKNPDGDEKVVRVHIIDGRQGYRMGYWVVGEDIGVKYANRCKDSKTGDLYVIQYFEGEEPKVRMLTKEQWHMAQKKFELLSLD